MTTLTRDLADGFATLALSHVSREFPNKLDHVLAGPEDVTGPRTLHPVFFGSFDWHSCVHGYWLLARTLRRFPDLPSGPRIEALFAERVTPKRGNRGRILARPESRGFERPYGWAWLLALQAELDLAPGGAARLAAAALRPLADAFAGRFEAFLPWRTTRCGSARHQHGVRPAAGRRRCGGAAPGAVRADAPAGDRLVRAGP